ncbi:MAG TPA: isoamylase early set domain-containing protein [Polyangia bacterium]|nr:isoamylase early set domain-containing protein [Polyangia bacterium]
MSGPDPRDKDFVDAVMRQIATRPLPRPSWWRRMFAAREVTLRFRPASWALAAVTIFLLGALVARSRHPAPTVTVATTHHGAGDDVPTLVRFSLHAPGARAVALAGDFNGWRPDVTPLRRGGDGQWIVEVPLTQGNWSYSFVVDGKWVEDPLAESWRADGFGGKNAVVRVGDVPALVGEARDG